ncbi:erythromycin esterase family protein [Streptosporangium sp. NPDC001559]|uniref:erythromycin esterase family protein n=1 Tax=Streptosporangium sp. NPDC001559 TaxID=3366187 RepID=UPI0036E05FB7
MPVPSHLDPFAGWLRDHAAPLDHLDPEAPLDDLPAQLATTIPVGVEEPLRWMRRHNATAKVPMRFAGIDIPAAGGSLLPALAPLADYLRDIDPEILPAVEQAVRIAGSFAGSFAGASAAAPAWAHLPAAG